jgi:hypothetical protein
MRRPREVGIVMMMLLGLSGCAGMPQQGSWASPSGATAYGTGADERPLARLAWWRRPKAEPNTPPGDASATTNPGKPGLLASVPASSSDSASARPTLLRRFTLLGQRLTGNKSEDLDPSDRPAWKFGSPAAGPVTTAYAAPASSRSVSGPTASVSSSASAGAGPYRIAGSSGAVALDLSGRKPQLDASAIPAGHSGTVASSPGDNEAAPPAPVMPVAYAQSPPPARPAPDQDLIPPAPISQPTGTPPSSPPASPSLTPSNKPSSSTLPPEANPPTSSGTPVSTLPPQQQAGSPTLWDSSPVSNLGPGEVFIDSSGPTAYEAPTYVQSSGKTCNLLDKLCPLKKFKQPLPSAQVLPTSQSCETIPAAKVKKPCFLKTFLHNKTCAGKGCGCAGDGCDAHALTASPQGVLPTSQW